MAFFGMRGTGDWADDQRPMSWRKMILRQFPNGDAPLTAMLSKMKSEVTTDPQYHWWTKSLPGQAGAITDIYTDVLSTSYTSGGAAGDTLYVKMALATLDEIRVDHLVTLRDASDLTVDVVARVTARTENGASSYATIKLLEADDNSTESNDLSDADRILVTGNATSEGASMPDAVSYDPTKWYNYTQIMRTPLEITGTAIETELRTNPQAYQELKREVLELHSIEMEKNFWWGVPSETLGSNGKKLRTTLGIIPAIRGGYTGHGGLTGTVANFATGSAWSGQSWLAGGEDWLDTQLEVMFRYGKKDKLAFCGSGALMRINKLIKNGSDFSFGPDTTHYGMRVKNWVTVQGTIGLVTHPLFSQETTTRNIMAIIEPENLKYKHIANRDTKFIGEEIGKTNTGYARRDGKKEEYLTECGLEYHFPNAWGYLSGFGETNTA